MKGVYVRMVRYEHNMSGLSWFGSKFFFCFFCFFQIQIPFNALLYLSLQHMVRHTTTYYSYLLSCLKWWAGGWQASASAWGSLLGSQNTACGDETGTHTLWPRRPNWSLKDQEREVKTWKKKKIFTSAEEMYNIKPFDRRAVNSHEMTQQTIHTDLSKCDLHRPVWMWCSPVPILHLLCKWVLEMHFLFLLLGGRCR